VSVKIIALRFAWKTGKNTLRPAPVQREVKKTSERNFLLVNHSFPERRLLQLHFMHKTDHVIPSTNPAPRAI